MEQRSLRVRWLVVWILAVVWIAAVAARLGYLQIVRYADYFQKAQKQQQRSFEISPKRGPIYDRRGRELAVSIPMDSAFADPAEIKDAYPPRKSKPRSTKPRLPSGWPRSFLRQRSNASRI